MKATTATRRPKTSPVWDFGIISVIMKMKMIVAVK